MNTAPLVSKGVWSTPHEYIPEEEGIELEAIEKNQICLSQQIGGDQEAQTIICLFVEETNTLYQ